MNPDGATLSSIASSLEELTRRITGIAERYQDTDLEDVALSLYEAERALGTARRRIDKATSTLST
jgi:hypothetical protein